MACEPTFLGYQILGDSQLLRFSKRFTSFRRKSNGDISSGLCLGGQKIEDLLRRIRTSKNKISEKLILMIGTNDVLQNTDFERMCFFLDRILLQLMKDGARHMILLTIPPIPKLDPYEERSKTLKRYNEFIRKRHNGRDIFVIDAYERFIEKAPEKSELKPFGLSQNINRDCKNLDETVDVTVMKKEFDEKNYSCSEDDASLIPTKNNSDECKSWLERRYVYNPLSDYTCDTDSCGEVKSYCINLSYFEKFFYRSNNEDLIHLNSRGLELIKELIIGEDYIKS